MKVCFQVGINIGSILEMIQTAQTNLREVFIIFYHNCSVEVGVWGNQHYMNTHSLFQRTGVQVPHPRGTSASCEPAQPRGQQGSRPWSRTHGSPEQTGLPLVEVAADLV